MGGGRLACAREADDADDATRACRDFAHHRLLLVGEDDPVGTLDLVEALLGDRRRVRLAAALDECKRGSFDGHELGGRVAGRATWARSLSHPLDAICLREPCREAAHALGRRARRVRFRPGHDDIGIGERGSLLG